MKKKHLKEIFIHQRTETTDTSTKWKEKKNIKIVLLNFKLVDCGPNMHITVID